MKILLSLRRRLRGIALLTAPALLVFVLGRLGASHSSGTLLVLAEPLLLALALYGVAAFGLHQKWRMSMATLLALGTGAIALHLPVDRPTQRTAVPDWLRPLRGCAILPSAAQAPVRLVTWTVDDSMPIQETLDEIEVHRPDLVVLLGTDDRNIGTALSDAMEGEVKFFPGGGGVTTAVRGNFQYCGGTTDHWSLDLPASEAGSAQAILTFPHIEHVGIIPLMIVRTDHPQNALDLPSWSQRLVDAASVVGSAAQVLGPRRMLVVGDFQVPSRAQPVAHPLRKSGLRPVATPPNWPSRVAGLPFLPIHALDQLWAGRGWHAQRAQVMPAGNQVREPIMVDLTPSEAHAR